MHAHVREVGILISNHTMREGDRGVVVVGSSVDLGKPYSSVLLQNSLHKFLYSGILLVSV